MSCSPPALSGIRYTLQMCAMGVWVRAKRLIEAKPYAAPHSLTHSLTHSSVAVSPLTRLPSPISLTVYRHRARRHRGGVVGEVDPTTRTITIITRTSGAVVGEVRAWHTQSKTTTTTAAAAAAHIIIDNTAHTHTQPHTLTCACPCPLPLLPSLSPACMCALSLGAYMHA